MRKTCKLSILSDKDGYEIYQYYQNHPLSEVAKYIEEKYGIKVSLPSICTYFKSKGWKVLTRAERWNKRHEIEKQKWISQIKEMLEQGKTWREIAIVLGVSDVALRSFRKKYGLC